MTLVYVGESLKMGGDSIKIICLVHPVDIGTAKCWDGVRQREICLL